MPEPETDLVRVVRGTPDDAEIAALLAALRAARQPETPTTPQPPCRPRVHHGGHQPPNAWSPAVIRW